MKGLSKQFVPYEQSLQLVELGFDEECLGFYTELGNLVIKENVKQQDCVGTKCVAPLFSQAFDWFRLERGLFSSIYIVGMSDMGYSIHDDLRRNLSSNIINITYEIQHKLYEEAREACLIKLIDLCGK